MKTKNIKRICARVLAIALSMTTFLTTTACDVNVSIGKDGFQLNIGGNNAGNGGDLGGGDLGGGDLGGGDLGGGDLGGGDLGGGDLGGGDLGGGDLGGGDLGGSNDDVGGGNTGNGGSNTDNNGGGNNTDSGGTTEEKPLVIKVGNFGGGVGKAWLDNAGARFAELVKDEKYVPGTKGVTSK